MRPPMMQDAKNITNFFFSLTDLTVLFYLACGATWTSLLAAGVSVGASVEASDQCLGADWWNEHQSGLWGSSALRSEGPRLLSGSSPNGD